MSPYDSYVVTGPVWNPGLGVYELARGILRLAP
jgi:hypothetical protein